MSFRFGAAACGAMFLLALSCSASAGETAKKARSTDAKTIDRSAEVKTAGIKAGAPIIGAASTYNPNRPGRQEGGQKTASGERYDVFAWAAAIKTTLRDAFGGVRFGAKPKFALVEGAGKKAIVKVNDVGPLKPGRVIDLNERAMRYFDPSLERGVIARVKVTPLAGDKWTPGPVAAAEAPSAG